MLRVLDFFTPTSLLCHEFYYLKRSALIDRPFFD